MTHISRLLGRSAIEENGDEKSDLDLGLPTEIDWGTYSHSIIESLSEKKMMNAKKGKRFSFDVLNVFERAKAKGKGANMIHITSC